MEGHQWRCVYMDEKWKLSKKGSSCSGSRRVVASGGGEGGSFLTSSSSTKTRRSSFTRRCASLVKEQRARFYIMRRCVTMLICWREYQDC